MIAQAGGLTYSLPQRQQFAQPQPEMQQQAPQGSPFSAPIGEDLAYVEDLTNNYYNAYGRMKDFTETMWKDYGVDVTKPDFAQPGGGLMHQAFQKMDADLRMTANDLSQERKIREEQRKAVLEGKAIYAPGYQEQAQLARTLPQEQRIISLELFPEVEQALQGVSNRVYNTPTEREAAFATLKPMIAKYEQLKLDDPQNARRYQRQIDALRKPTYSLPDVSFRAPSGVAQEQQNYLTMAKKIANDWKGNWTEGVSYKYDPILKQQVAVIEPEGGLMMGKATVGKNEVDKIIKRYIKTPDGAVYAEFDNPKIPRERLDTKSSDEAVTTIMTRNPAAFGGQEAVNFLNQYRGTTGSYDVSNLYQNPEEYQQIVQQAKGVTKDLPARQEALANVKAKIKKRMPVSGQLGMSFLWDTPINIKDLLADYPAVANKIPSARIETEGDGYKFTDSNGFKAITGLPEGWSKNYTEEEIISFLADYVGEVVNLQSPAQTSAQAPVTKKTITQAQFDQAAKAEGAITPADIAEYKKQLESVGITIQ